MSTVSDVFPGFANLNKRTIRAPINPLDKSTIVSIMPKPIHEVKHTIQPGVFDIAPGSIESPAILIVGPSSWWRDVDEDQPLLEIPVSSIQIANSIVRDFCNGILACNMSNRMPGLFYVAGCQNDAIGNVSVPETLKWIKKTYAHELKAAEEKQKNWYAELVRLADSLWARSNGNPLVVADDMRMAAKELGVHGSKDWMKDHKMVDMVRCFACGSMKNPEYPICATCRAVDPNHPKAADIKFAL